MTTIRIGNDIDVVWKIFSRDGSTFALEGMTTRVWLLSGPFKKEITDHKVSGHIVSFNIDADEVNRYGIYKLLLSILDDDAETEDASFDETFVFQIVSKTYRDTKNNVLDGNVVITPHSVLNNFIPSDAQPGESAYEIAVRHGYEGSEDSWVNEPGNGLKAVGIVSIKPVGTPSDAGSAVNTYRITMNNGTTFDFSVTNGNSIESITPVGSVSQEASALNTYRIRFSNGRTFDFSIKNGTGISSVTADISKRDSGTSTLTIVLSDGTRQTIPIKNGKGITSVVQETVGIGSDAANIFRINYSDGMSRTFSIKNGSQGNTGSSVDYPFELINNLTTDDATKGLSAAQGVVLDTKIVLNENKVGGVRSVSSLSVDKKYDLVWINNECITSDGSIRKGMSDDICACEFFIPVKAGQRLYLNLNAPGSTDVCVWYDQGYNFVSYFTASQEYVTVPQDGYLRVSNEQTAVASPYVLLVTSDYLSNKELESLNFDALEYDKQVAAIFDFPLNLTWEEGQTLFYTTGEPSFNNPNYAYTPKYSFTFPGQKFKIELIGSGTARSVCFYDANKTFISGHEGGIDIDIVAPQNARYVRFGTEDKSHEVVINVHTEEPFGAKDILTNVGKRVDSIEQYVGASYPSLSPVGEGLLSRQTGEVYPHVQGDAYRYCPTYFRVYPGQKLHVTGRSTNTCAGVCFYDENYGFISGQDGALSLSGTIVVPADVAYARFCTEYYTTSGLSVSFEPIAKIPGIGNEDKPYFVSDVGKYDTNIQVSSQRTFNPSTEKIEHKYIGQVTPEKRYMSVGFDDFRESDFSIVMPLFEKYGFKATFNRIARSVTLSSTDKANLNRLIMGRHELGDHSWLHHQFPFTEPMFNGQDPSNPEGGQVPFPTNAQMRNNRGDGKNVFGISLDTPVSTTNWYEGPGINTAWGSLSDAECQTIRNWYSVMKDTSTNLIEILDALSNMFLGTTGSSRGSWDNTTRQYTGGIFTGCKTSANHEIWERYLMVTQMFYKEVAGINYNIRTWSMPGSKDSNCWFEREGKHYYDSSFTKYANYLAKFPSSSLSNADGTPKTRSWTDCLREFGYTATHDYIWPGRLDGTNATAKYIGTQFVLNAKGRRYDAIPYASNSSRDFDYDTAATAYPESAMTGSTSLAAQMYDSTNNPAFKNFIEAARRKMSNGIVAVEIADSQNTYSFRLFFEALLKYCKTTGVELITKQEAYDICFNHSIRSGNLVYNPHLRNTAKEFMPDAQTVPDNPDGYVGNCSVTYDLNGTPILNTAGTTVYNHLGIPEGSLFYKAKAKGTGTIKLQAIKNNNSIYITDDRVVLATKEVNYEDFEEISIPFAIREPIDGEYDQIYEGLGEKIIGLGVEYSAGLQIKDIKIEFQGSQSSGSDPSPDMSGKANIDSPTFTGTPAAPTAPVGTNTTQIATTEFVNTAVADAIDGISIDTESLTPTEVTNLLNL